MRSLNSNLVLVSAYNSKLSNEQNHANHEKAIEMLNRDGTKYRVVNGMYEGSKELVFLLSTTDANVHDENVSTAYSLGHLFNQDSILEVHNDGTSVLHYLEGASRQIGSFKEVSESVALSKNAYTYEPVSKRYFVVE